MFSFGQEFYVNEEISSELIVIEHNKSNTKTKGRTEREKGERNVRKRDGEQKGIKRDIETKGELDR